MGVRGRVSFESLHSGDVSRRPVIRFVRLPEVPLSAVVDLLNEPRNARHMPLAGAFDEEAAAAWVQAKDDQWSANGYGPWAVLVDDEFAGWGGFQREQGEADFGLVLAPTYWGLGADIAKLAFDVGFADLGVDQVVIALPRTRDPDRAVARWGFERDGTINHGGATFLRYRLPRERWLSGATPTAQRPQAQEPDAID